MRLVAFLMILAYGLSESGELLQRLWPEVAGRSVSPFINYEWPWPDRPLLMGWWIKYNTDAFLMCTLLFCMAIIAKKHSLRMLNVACIFFLYHIIDWFLLWYDYRQSHWYYWVVFFFYGWGTVAMLWPMKKDKAKVIEWSSHSTSIQDY